MTKQDLPTVIKGPRVVPSIDFKEIERIHKEWERYDLDGRYKVVPKFNHGSTLTMRSSGDTD